MWPLIIACVLASAAAVYVMRRRRRGVDDGEVRRRRNIDEGFAQQFHRPPNLPQNPGGGGSMF